MKPAPLSGAVKSLLDAIDKRYPDRAHRVYDVWPEAVGADIARRSAPLTLKRGKLTVAVEGSAWLQELSLRQSLVIANLNRLLGPGAVKSVRFVAAVSLPSEEEEESFDRSFLDRPLTKEEEARIDDAVADLPEGELQSAVRDAMRASLLRSSLKDYPK